MVKVVIRSIERATGTIEDYTFRVHSPIKNAVRFTLLEALIPKSIPPVLTGYNDSFDLTDGNASYTIEVPEGQYTGAEFAAAFNIDANNTAAAAGSVITYAMTYSSTTNKFMFSASGADAPATLDTNTTPAAAQVVGQAVATIVGNQTMPLQANISWPDSLYIDVTLGTSQGQDMWDSNTSHSYKITFGEANFGEFEYATIEERFPQFQLPANVNFQDIRISFRMPDRDAAAVWSFQGINHELAFEVTGTQ